MESYPVTGLKALVEEPLRQRRGRFIEFPI